MDATFSRSLTQSKRNLNLIIELSITQFKLKYAGSLLGYLWSLVKPLLTFATMYIVFDRFLHVAGKSPDFIFQLLFSIIIWNFFAETVGTTMGSVVANANLVQKTYFPRWILVLASTISSLFTFIINICLITLIAMSVHGISLGWQSLLAPLLFFELYLFAIGLALFLSSLFVVYRDMGHIWEWFSLLMFYGSCVVYPFSYVHNKVAEKIIGINPIAQIIEDIRYTVVTQGIPTMHSVIGNFYYLPFAFVLISLVVGGACFSIRSKHFAENL